MIPYFTIPPIDLGSAVIHPFAICFFAGWVSLAVIGIALGARSGHVLPGVVAAVAAPLVGLPAGHLLYMVSYRPEGLSRPIELLIVWRGFLGIGVAGSILATAAASSLLVPAQKRLRSIEAVTLGLISGWWFHRLGCTIIHDHPGAETDFFLGVQGICQNSVGYRTQSNAACHDLGMYEWLLATACGLAGIYAWRRWPGKLVVLAIPLVAYPPFRVLTQILDDNPPQSLWVEQIALVGSLILGLALLRPSRFRPHRSAS